MPAIRAARPSLATVKLLSLWNMCSMMDHAVGIWRQNEAPTQVNLGGGGIRRIMR